MWQSQVSWASHGMPMQITQSDQLLHKEEPRLSGFPSCRLDPWSTGSPLDWAGDRGSIGMR